MQAGRRHWRSCMTTTSTSEWCTVALVVVVQVEECGPAGAPSWTVATHAQLRRV